MDKSTNQGHREPTPLGNVLGRFMIARGYNRLRSMGELEKAWTVAVGPEIATRTKIGTVRHGILTVIVAHSTLLDFAKLRFSRHFVVMHQELLSMIYVFA
jgi:Dna[CI] antecedent, DciA